ncbi:MAG: PadR family transcriptional regulator [Clostridia bacterium]|nr:PadR family transcriptional regulator [Clostridia bacterium]
MVKSSEFIKGYTEIIACALLSKGDDYIYNIVKTINEAGGGGICITNPSMLMIMKKLSEEGKVTSYTVAGGKGVDKRYYALTAKGREYYLSNRDDYILSLKNLINLVGGKDETEN